MVEKKAPGATGEAASRDTDRAPQPADSPGTNVASKATLDLESTRLSKQEAKKLVVRIVNEGTVTIPAGHARREMDNDGITDVDVRNVLKGGTICEEGELVKGTFRYRVHTKMFCVVVALRSLDEVAVVTAWRKKR